MLTQKLSMMLMLSILLLLVLSSKPNSDNFLLILVVSNKDFISFIPPQGVTISSVYSCRIGAKDKDFMAGVVQLQNLGLRNY